jgi:hypothetical protein
MDTIDKDHVNKLIVQLDKEIKDIKGIKASEASSESKKKIDNRLASVDHQVIASSDTRELTSKAQGELTNKRTEPQKFQFTPKMSRWLDTAIEIQSIIPAEISAKCKISRDSYYRWRLMPGFNEWFTSEWQAQRRRWISTLDVMGMKRASKSFDYWKAMKQTLGELVEGGNSINVSGDKVIAIMGGNSSGIKQDTTSDKQDT